MKRTGFTGKLFHGRNPSDGGQSLGLKLLQAFLLLFIYLFVFLLLLLFREQAPRDAEQGVRRLFWSSKKNKNQPPTKLFLQPSPQSLKEQQHLPSPSPLINANDRRGLIYTDCPRAARTSEAVTTPQAP